MSLDSDTRRRLIGGLVLTMAVVMLICGETILKGKLSPLGFLLYWLGCFAFTITAVFIALADVKALRVRTQREQKDLLESTLKEIKTGASSRTGDGKPGYISDGKNSSTSNLN
jgi:hypothetical protein